MQDAFKRLDDLRKSSSAFDRLALHIRNKPASVVPKSSVTILRRSERYIEDEVFLEDDILRSYMGMQRMLIRIVQYLSKNKEMTPERINSLRKALDVVHHYIKREQKDINYEVKVIEKMESFLELLNNNRNNVPVEWRNEYFFLLHDTMRSHKAAIASRKESLTLRENLEGILAHAYDQARTGQNFLEKARQLHDIAKKLSRNEFENKLKLTRLELKQRKWAVIFGQSI
jgi:hypothetical protein